MGLDYERGRCYYWETRSWQLPSAAALVYQRRRPERSVAHQVVKQNLETWLARRRVGGLDAGADWVVYPVPAYVERDLWKYLECGMLADGFARARCEMCRQGFWVAYSRKGRGVCPACNTRRMVETAAHMVEHVSGSGRAAVGGDISEALVLLFER